MSLLVEYFNELPQRDDEGEISVGGARLKRALESYKARVQERYTEGTLQRLLHSPDTQSRRAAVMALGLVASLESNKATARMLHDADRVVRQLASEALWAMWFRADSEEN